MPLDNRQTTSPRGFAVKHEPEDPPLFKPPPPSPCPAPLPSSATTHPQASGSAVKSEPVPSPPRLSSNASRSNVSTRPSLPAAIRAEVNLNPKPNVDRPVLARKADEALDSGDGIIYTPENALAKGLQMADTIGSYLQQVDLGSSSRKDIWLRKVGSLKSQDLPRTMIAVCGATGAGKSSLLNAVLDDNIVPTSGMRACTAVATEIGYHNKTTIAAEIEFLALSEWKAELELLDDLVDKNGKLRRQISDSRSDLGVAWHKIQAVYPLLALEHMIKMTPDEIIAAHPDIQRILGSTCKIESPNSEAFALEIAQYVDSGDQKRNRDIGKEKSKTVDPALWPLIRLVRVRCNAAALKCGAMLVDLPGVADANLARSSIAKEYMKKCDRIWIVAPITRAVDDKTARDLLGEAFRTQLMNGNYDDSTITFIATKTDDISCSETIPSLGLGHDPELAEIENTIKEVLAGTKEWTNIQAHAKEETDNIDNEIKVLQFALLEYKKQLAASRPTEPFRQSSYKKRKLVSRGGRPKRQRSHGDEDVVMDEDEEELNVENDVIVISSDSDEATDSDDGQGGGESKPKINSPLFIQKSLEELIAKKEVDLNALREQWSVQHKDYQNAVAELADYAKLSSTIEKKKSAFCSIKRNEYSRDALKEDFRQGLEELDQMDEEIRNPDICDPSQDLRDYSAIDLRVFTCSSRDYIRIKKQVNGDGGPSCFTNPEDTEIPALQQWCHELTMPAREQFACSLLNDLAMFLHSIHAYFDMEGVSVADRTKFAGMWKSSVLPSEFGGDLGLTRAHPAVLESPPATPPTKGRRACKRSESPSLPESSLSGIARRIEQLEDQKPAIFVWDKGKGISSRLRNHMEKVVLDGVARLKQVFRNGIEERSRMGAEKAKQGAVETSDKLAASVHWNTYRAILRRHGEYNRDLNAELVAPMTREIASSWAQVFESDLFTQMNFAARTEIDKLLKEIEDSAPAGLKDRCETQTQATLKEVKIVTANILRNITTAMTNEQKEISRCITPHVKSELLDGYNLAMEEQGKGSVARQKEVFHDYVEQNRETIFDNSADSLFDKLDQAAESVGMLLRSALDELSEKVEVSVSTLWEVPNGNGADIAGRCQLVKHIHAMLEELKPWVEASKNATNVNTDMDTGTDDEADVGVDTIEMSGQPDN